MRKLTNKDYFSLRIVLLSVKTQNFYWRTSYRQFIIKFGKRTLRLVKFTHYLKLIHHLNDLQLQIRKTTRLQLKRLLKQKVYKLNHLEWTLFSFINTIKLSDKQFLNENYRSRDAHALNA